AEFRRTLAEHCRRHPHLDLTDVAFTLGAGRAPLAARWGVRCSSLAELVDALDHRAATPDDDHPGLAAWRAGGDLPPIPEWDGARRVALPSRPFEGKRWHLESPGEVALPATPVPIPVDGATPAGA